MSEAASGGGTGPKPAIRGMQTQTLLGVVAMLPKADRTAFYAAVRPEVLQAAEESHRLTWFPMADHMHLCVTIDQIIGRERFLAVMTETFRAAVHTPMLRGIFSMLRRMADDAMVTLIRNAPRVYGYVARDVGKLRTLEVRPHHAVIEMRDWPSSAFDFDVWVAGLQGCIRGGMAGIAPTESADVAVESRDPAHGIAVYRVRW